MTRRRSDPTLRVPDIVSGRLLAVQPRLREISPQAREWGLIKRLLNFREAIVERPVPLGPRELAFWENTDDADQERFLFDNLLASAPLAPDDAAWPAYPSAYRALLDVLRFEQHRQFDGWTAVTNLGVDGMARVVAAYRAVGLREEAQALAEAAALLAAAPADADLDEVEDAMEAAHVRRNGGTSTFEARIAAVIAHVRENPQLFGEAR